MYKVLTISRKIYTIIYLLGGELLIVFHNDTGIAIPLQTRKNINLKNSGIVNYIYTLILTC